MLERYRPYESDSSKDSSCVILWQQIKKAVQTQLWYLYKLSWWYSAPMWLGLMGGEGRDRSCFSDLAEQFHGSASLELCGRITHKHTRIVLPQELTKHSAASSMKPSWKRCSSLKVSAKAWRRLSEGRARSRLCWNWVKIPWRREQEVVYTLTTAYCVYRKHLCHIYRSMHSLNMRADALHIRADKQELHGYYKVSALIK